MNNNKGLGANGIPVGEEVLIMRVVKLIKQIWERTNPAQTLGSKPKQNRKTGNDYTNERRKYADGRQFNFQVSRRIKQGVPLSVVTIYR